MRLLLIIGGTLALSIALNITSSLLPFHGAAGTPETKESAKAWRMVCVDGLFGVIAMCSAIGSTAIL
jgi:hypothetical protein